MNNEEFEYWFDLYIHYYLNHSEERADAVYEQYLQPYPEKFNEALEDFLHYYAYESV